MARFWAPRGTLTVCYVTMAPSCISALQCLSMLIAGDAIHRIARHRLSLLARGSLALLALAAALLLLD